MFIKGFLKLRKYIMDLEELSPDFDVGIVEKESPPTRPFFRW